MFTRKYLDELLKKFPTPSFPNNKFFKGVKVLGNEILLLAEISKQGLKANYLRTHDDIDARVADLLNHFSQGIRTDKPLPIVYKFKGEDGYYLVDGFGRVTMFEGNNQLFYPFTVVEITDPKYRDNIGSWANEDCPKVISSVQDRVNQLVKRIKDPACDDIINTEKSIRSYIKGVMQTIDSYTTDKVVTQVLERVSIGTDPDHWNTLDGNGVRFNEWNRDHSSVDYGLLKTKEKGKPTTTYKGLKVGQWKQGYGDRNIPTSIRRYAKWGIKTGWVLHCNSPKDFDDLTGKRVKLLKDMLGWNNDLCGIVTSKGKQIITQETYKILGFFPQDWSNKGEVKKRLVSVKQVLKQASNLDIDVTDLMVLA